MTSLSQVNTRTPHESLGDTHELMTREGTDGLLHFGLKKAACGATPSPECDISLVDYTQWVDCPHCRQRLKDQPDLKPA